MRLLRSRMVAAAAIVTAASAGLTVANAGQSDPDRVVAAVSQPVTSSATAAALDAFRAAATARDRAPLDSGTTVPGANPQLARLAHEDGRQKVWLVPGQQGVCLVSSAGIARGCADSSDVTAGTGLQAILCSPNLDRGIVEISGVVPNGVDQVRLEGDGFAALTAPVNHNTLIVDLSKSGSLPTRITWTAQGRSTTVPSPIPPDAAQEDCRS